MKHDVKSAGPTQADKFTSMLELLAYPLALGAGYIPAETEVRKSIYSNLAKQGIFNDIQAVRREQYQSALNAVKSGELPNMAHAMQHIEGEYRHNVLRRFQELGMHSMGDYWRGMQRNQKINALVMGATVSGIAIGAMLTITNNNWVAHVLRDRQQDEASPPL